MRMGSRRATGTIHRTSGSRRRTFSSELVDPWLKSAQEKSDRAHGQGRGRQREKKIADGGDCAGGKASEGSRGGLQL